jgi:prevent-host-death family protein
MLKGNFMRAIPVHEAKTRFSEMIAAVEQGEAITITRHGAPVARLVAIGAASGTDPEQRQRVLGAMADLRRLGADMEMACSLSDAIHNGRD